jgi:hypothetical protein
VARKFLTPVRFPDLATDPVGTGYGDMYLNTVTNQLRYFDGSEWHNLTASSGGGGGGNLNQLEVFSSPPTPANEGRIYFDHNFGVIKTYDGHRWNAAAAEGFIDGGYASTTAFFDIIEGGYA